MKKFEFRAFLRIDWQFMFTLITFAMLTAYGWLKDCLETLKSFIFIDTDKRMDERVKKINFLFLFKARFRFNLKPK